MAEWKELPPVPPATRAFAWDFAGTIKLKVSFYVKRCVVQLLSADGRQLYKADMTFDDSCSVNGILERVRLWMQGVFLDWAKELGDLPAASAAAPPAPEARSRVVELEENPDG